MDVSKNRGTQKLMVIMENRMKMDDLGVPRFLETPTLEMSQKTSANNRENFVILPNFPTVNLRRRDLTFIQMGFAS